MEIFGDFRPSVIRAFEEIDLYWKHYPGLVITGSHTPQDVEMLLDRIEQARETGLPFYGECWGYQLAAIEYARSIGVKDATSEEWGHGTFIVRKRKDGLNVGLKEGESYWNNYEVEPKFESHWIKSHNFFIAQYHASYQSRLGMEHPLIKNFLKYAKSFNHSSFV